MNGIILASGFSRRMGQNKLLMKIKEETIIEKVIKEVKKSEIEKVYIVTNNEEIKNIAYKLEVKVIKNENAIKGQSEGIKAGVKKIKENEDFMFFCGDQPFIDFITINNLINAFKENKDKIIVPIFENRKGNPVIFPGKFRLDLLGLEGDIGGRYIIKKHKDNVIFFEVEKEIFLKDIDNYDEYKEMIK
ncbi:molybdenum cofactor cytidylyltransferase [Clostridium sp.]|uniref:molybdenum cofactor cytidylyltransferase n=1 Tax=Clostridium sp. TaxID=1506 RepID=UPI0026182BA5|nr:molybdenum cofactor cytidylyltransferase [Clostridium sp.]